MNEIRMTTEVPDVGPETITYGALHFAFHMGYITRNEVVTALQSFGMPGDRYRLFYNAWARRHGLTPRTDA